MFNLKTVLYFVVESLNLTTFKASYKSPKKGMIALQMYNNY